MNNRILITGADGFVGGHLIDALLQMLPPDTEIFAAQRNLKHRSAKFLVPIELDVTNTSQVKSVVSEVQPTCILHLAAIAAIQDAQAQRHQTWLVNFEGTRSLVEAVLNYTPKARFIFISSSEIYGGSFKHHIGSVDEKVVLDPTNTYAASKAAADLLVGQMVREGLNAIRIRPFNHTGSGQSEAFVVPAFAAQIARIEAGQQEPRLLVGNLEARRDFLDVRDVVDAYVKTIFHPALTPGTIFNIASGVPRRIQDVLESLCKHSSKEILVELDPSRMRPSDTPNAIGNAHYAKTELGWHPKIEWDDTLSKVMSYWRSQTKSIN